MSSKLEYLKRYADGGADDGAGGEKKKRKKKKRRDREERGHAGNVVVVDGASKLERFEEERRRARAAAAAGGAAGVGAGAGAFVDGGAALAASAAAGARGAGAGPRGGMAAVRAHAAASGWSAVPAARTARASDSDGDMSPPRRGARHDTPEPGGSDGDLSPPRRNARHDTPDGDGSEGDLSPPRRAARHDTPEPGDSDGDMSPPRRRARHDTPEPGDSNGDMSPPRRGARHDTPEPGDSDGDMSPPRRGRGARHDTPDGDGGSGSGGDMSPPRRGATAAAGEGAAAGAAAFVPKSGLRTAEEMKAEAVAMRAAEAARMERMDASMSGRGAATVARGHDGKRLDDVSAAAREKREADEAARVLPWRGGLAQQRAAEAAKRAQAEAGAAPFALSADRRDGELRARARFGDPMARLAAQQELEALGDPHADPDFGGEEAKRAMAEAGYSIPAGVPEHSWLRRGVGAPPNRYGIRPGRFWDGVDRGTGFEQKIFAAQNERAMKARAARTLATADM